MKLNDIHDDLLLEGLFTNRVSPVSTISKELKQVTNILHNSRTMIDDLVGNEVKIREQLQSATPIKQKMLVNHAKENRQELARLLQTTAMQYVKATKILQSMETLLDEIRTKKNIELAQAVVTELDHAVNSFSKDDIANRDMFDKMNLGVGVYDVSRHNYGNTLNNVLAKSSDVLADVVGVESPSYDVDAEMRKIENELGL